MTKRYSIAYEKRDVFGAVAGSGWVILEDGKRIDWPTLATEAEAKADLRDFQRSIRQLASDEASERYGISLMSPQ